MESERRMSVRPNNRGFSLIELVMVMAMYSIVIAGIAGIYVMAIKNQKKIIRDTFSANQGTLVRRAIDAVGGREAFGVNYDPSHLVWQGLDCARFIDHFSEIGIKDIRP